MRYAFSWTLLLLLAATTVTALDPWVLSDTLKEGESTSITAGATTYEVTLLLVDETGTEAKWLVNGEVSDAIGVLESDTLSTGATIATLDITELIDDEPTQTRTRSAGEYFVGYSDSVVLTEGKTSTITMGDQTYEVTLLLDASTGVRVMINGEVLESIESGEEIMLDPYTLVMVEYLDSAELTDRIVEVSIVRGRTLRLKEGETLPIKISGYAPIDFTVLLVSDVDDKAKVLVNGAVSPAMTAGEHDVIAGTYFVLTRSTGEVSTHVDRTWLAEFRLTLPVQEYRPDIWFLVDERASIDDVRLMIKIADQFFLEAELDKPLGVAKLFEEVTPSQLRGVISVMVYEGNALIVVDEQAPTRDVQYVGIVSLVLDMNGIKHKTIFTSDVTNEDYERLFEKHFGSTPVEPPSTPVWTKRVPKLGQADAPVVMEVYCSLTGPFCERWYNGVKDQLESAYVEDGKLLIWFRDFPLDFHPHSVDAAVALRCVAQSGSSRDYFSMLDRIYASDTPLAEMRAELTAQELRRMAAQTNADIELWDVCFGEGYEGIERMVLEDRQIGQGRGITGTPTFFINEERIVGAQGYDAYAKIIDRQLELPGSLPSTPVPPGVIVEPDVSVIICLEKQDRFYTVPVLESQMDTYLQGGSYLGECKDEDEVPSETKPSKPTDGFTPQCQGCEQDDLCYPVGTRMLFEGESSYCSIEGNVQGQLALGESCQNNYECLSNQCSNGACIDLQADIVETQNLIQRFFSWLTNIF